MQNELKLGKANGGEAWTNPGEINEKQNPPRS